MKSSNTHTRSRSITGKLIACFIILMAGTPLLAQLSVTATTDQTTLTNALTSPGVTIANLTTNEGTTTSQIGTFSGGLVSGGPGPVIGVEDGVVLVGGAITSVTGPNTSASSSTGSASDNLVDADLGLMTGRTQNCSNGDQCDVVVLEFEVTPTGRSLEIDFVFAAEEFPEYVCSQFNDAVGIFVSGPGLSGPFSNSGINIATLDDGSAIAVNGVNGGIPGSNADGTACTLTNTFGFVYNTPADAVGAPNPALFTNTQFDGFTIPMSAKVVVTPNSTYLVRIVLADIGDSSWDTGFFLDLVRGGGLDYGDAPDSYSTTVLNATGISIGQGARHSIVPGLSLGATVDGDANGLPGAASDGDDTDSDNPTNGDDEDGIASFPVGFTGNNYTVTANATNTTGSDAFIVGYIDFNGDGDFDDTDEQSAPVTVPTGSNNAPFNVVFTLDPTNATTGSTYARFRISSNLASIQTPSGPAIDGEVEDYPIPAGFLPVVLASFSSQQLGRTTDFSWSTATETFNVGFQLYEDLNGVKTSISGGSIPSKCVNCLEPQNYQARLTTQGAGPFWLAEVDTSGRETFYGPFAMGETYGKQPTPHPIPWTTIRAQQTRLLADYHGQQQSDDARKNPQITLKVNQTGFHKLTFEALETAGFQVRGIAHDALALSVDGKPVYRQIISDDAFFGPGDTVIFWGEARQGDQYTSFNHYLLDLNRAQVRAVQAPPFEITGKPESHVFHEFRVENNEVYSFSAPNGDPWFDKALLSFGGPFSETRVIQVDQVARTAQQPVLEINYWGVTNWPEGLPDHHIEFYFNDIYLGDDIFDGLLFRSKRFSLQPEWLQNGANTLEIRVPGDTGYDFDLIHLESYALKYPRNLVAINGNALSFSSAAAFFEVRQFNSSNITAWATTGDVTYSLPTQVTSTKQNASVSFSGVGSVVRTEPPRYQVATMESMLTPLLQAAPRRQIPELDARGDLLIISHPSFMNALAPFVAFKQSQGHQVSLQNVQHIYDRYSFGRPTPDAIGTYIRFAASRLGTQSVLLVGGDTYDYQNRLGTGSISFIPSPYAQTHPQVYFAPVDPIFGDLDQDNIPDIPVGRFPVRELSELQILINKTTAPQPNAPRAIFVADDSPTEFFGSISVGLTQPLPKFWTSENVFLDLLDVGPAQAKLFAAINNNPALINFVGHSGPTAWTFDGLLNNDDLLDLQNTTPFTVIQWGCWNTYHVVPSYDTMGHQFLLPGNYGARAVIGAASLTSEASDQALGTRLFVELFKPNTTLGEAMIRAKQDLAASQPHVLDVILGWTLLGDPTAKLP